MRSYIFECLPQNGATSYTVLMRAYGLSVKAALDDCRSQGFCPIRWLGY